MRRLTLVGLLGFSLIFAACEDEGSQICEDPGSGTGTLQLTVTGLPESTPANVQLSGAPGTQIVNGTQTLELETGTYTLGPPQLVASSHPLFRTAYRPEGNTGPICVKAGERSEATIQFVPVPSSGKLWTSNGTGGTAPLLGFAANAVGDSGSPAATVAAKTGGSEGSAFDASGNLWVVGATTADPPLLMYEADTLGTSGEKTAIITLKGGPLEGGFPRARAVAFDSKRNLWVTVGFNNKIVRYNADQIAVSGSPTPAVQFTGLDGPSGVAFDASGNLWVAFTGDGSVGRYDVSRLSATADDPPNMVLHASSPPPVIGDLSAPTGLAFDAAGNLWANFNGTLARFTPADQRGTGSVTVTPEVQIGIDVSALPDGLLFDESGGLWLALGQGKFGRLGPNQLTSSGSKTPETLISSPDVGYSGWLAAFPAPANLPLYGRLP